MVTDSPINPEDIVEVTNTDVECNLLDPEIHPQGKNSAVVYYDRIPHSIEAGKTRLFPGYLATHYAKHLADHILTSQKKPTNDPSRSKIVSEILGAIKETFTPQIAKPSGEVVAEKVEEVNAKYELPAMDIGTDSNPTGEVAVTTLPETYEEIPVGQEVKPLPTNRELRAELDKLGIKYSITDNKDTLMSKIKEFAGV